MQFSTVSASQLSSITVSYNTKKVVPDIVATYKLILLLSLLEKTCRSKSAVIKNEQNYPHITSVTNDNTTSMYIIGVSLSRH